MSSTDGWDLAKRPWAFLSARPKQALLYWACFTLLNVFDTGLGLYQESGNELNFFISAFLYAAIWSAMLMVGMSLLHFTITSVRGTPSFIPANPAKTAPKFIVRSVSGGFMFYGAALVVSRSLEYLIQMTALDGFQSIGFIHGIDFVATVISTMVAMLVYVHSCLDIPALSVDEALPPHEPGKMTKGYLFKATFIGLICTLPMLVCDKGLMLMQSAEMFETYMGEVMLARDVIYGGVFLCVVTFFGLLYDFLKARYYDVESQIAKAIA